MELLVGLICFLFFLSFLFVCHERGVEHDAAGEAEGHQQRCQCNWKKEEKTQVEQARKQTSRQQAANATAATTAAAAAEAEAQHHNDRHTVRFP